MPRKKPESQEELQQDIESHPERGQINGEDVVRFDTTTVQLAIPIELYRQLLDAGAALGMNKKDIFNHAIASFVSHPGTVAMVRQWYEMKCDKYQVAKTEVRSKVLGSYKKTARAHMARIEK